jgi:Spy/CpxP family protein refolding chaperone
MSGMLGLLLSVLVQQEDPVDRQVNRLKEQLRLTDEQAAKARDIVKKQQDDIKGLLTDEQKPRYEESLRGGGRGNGNNPGAGNNNPGRGNQGRGGWFPSTDDLKSKLGLSDEQVTKINEMRDGIREEMRKMFQNRENRPGPDALEKLRTETTAKMRDLLTDEQKPKFDEALKSVQTPGAGGTFGGGRGGNSVDERVTRAMEALKFEKPEEADAVKGLVRKVVELQEKVETTLRENRGKLDEILKDTALSDDAVGDKLNEIRKPGKEFEKQLADARAKLVEVISSRQEIELLRRGVLR